MNEEEARCATLVRAIEQADTQYAVWSRADRQWATEAAARDTAADAPAERFIARRAALAAGRLEDGDRELARARRVTQWPVWLTWLAPIAAFALGVATNELGPERRVNILAFPMLGIIAWNLAVYVVLVASALTGAGRERIAVAMGPLTRFVAQLAHRSAPRTPDAGPLSRALHGFVYDWARLATPLDLARARALLHFCAALLALGAVAGLYLRGIGLEYVAGWESTFLTERAVHAVVSIVLGPASAISGLPLPGPEELARLRWGPGQPGERAAPWIHLYAITAALFVIVPRLALALASALGALRLRRAFPLQIAEDPYYRRLAALRHGKPVRVRIVPYSHTPDARAQEALRNAFADACASPVHVTFDEPVRYGGEDELEIAADTADVLVALFNMAATPEDENQGVMIERMRLGRGSAQLLVVLNETPYRERLAGQGGAGARLDERRAAWSALFGGRGVNAVTADLSADAAGLAKKLEARMQSGAEHMR